MVKEKIKTLRNVAMLTVLVPLFIVTPSIAELESGPCPPGSIFCPVCDNVTGTVYWDQNKNGQMDVNEPGIPDVCVSNSRDVVKTDANGVYILPACDEMVVFVVKPTGWMTPVKENNVPQFFYIHKPEGSPEEIQSFSGLDPTGPLPEAINFPLYNVDEPKNFKAIVIGDTEVYNDREINYLRDSLVKDAKSADTGALFCIVMGDNVGDELSLYPRYLSVMGEMDIPVYYVPGTHDLDLDATQDKDSFDTFKNYVGPTYFSFNYGQVHFVVLDSVEYPSPVTKTDPNRPPFNSKYNGKIDDIQLQWLVNDLATVPIDNLIVLNMNIPIVSDVDRLSDKDSVENREDLYCLLEGYCLLQGRKFLSLAGHSNTLAHFLPGDELECWGQATPIPQIIVGAASGSWWSGDLDDNLVPYSYMRDGTPRNYLIFDFNDNEYTDTFKGTLRCEDKQMHMAFLTSDFLSWFDALANDCPDMTILGLDNRNILTETDLLLGLLVVNFYSGSSSSIVTYQFDDGLPFEAFKTMEVMDPFALANQMYVLRGVPGFELWQAPSFMSGTAFGPSGPVKNPDWMQSTEGKSTHLWVCDIPDDLEPGVHSVTVTAVDTYGKEYKDIMVFEVADEAH